MLSVLKDKVLLITGGTGSFGNAVVKKILSQKIDVKEIRIFSRDEKKQWDMAKLYNSDKLKFFIGDVRDKATVDVAMQGVDYVFSAAALKQVPSCENFPFEAVKTNIVGTKNVLDSAIENKVEKVVVLSTDKAVYPINAMGMSKAMAEKIAIAKAKEQNTTKICRTRYGNVMCSRGSVIPLFKEQIQSGKKITITDEKMTRFMMTLEEAVDLVFEAFEKGWNGDLFVQKSPACTVGVLAEAIKKIMKADTLIEYTGARIGEKLHETLLTSEERSKSLESNKYFCVPIKNKPSINEKGEYRSDNTTILDVDEVVELLKKTGEF